MCFACLPTIPRPRADRPERRRRRRGSRRARRSAPPDRRHRRRGGADQLRVREHEVHEDVHAERILGGRPVLQQHAVAHVRAAIDAGPDREPALDDVHLHRRLRADDEQRVRLRAGAGAMDGHDAAPHRRADRDVPRPRRLARRRPSSRPLPPGARRSRSGRRACSARRPAARRPSTWTCPPWATRAGAATKRSGGAAANATCAAVSSASATVPSPTSERAGVIAGNLPLRFQAIRKDAWLHPSRLASEEAAAASIPQASDPLSKKGDVTCQSGRPDGRATGRPAAYALLRTGRPPSSNSPAGHCGPRRCGRARPSCGSCVLVPPFRHAAATAGSHEPARCAAVR